MIKMAKKMERMINSGHKQNRINGIIRNNRRRKMKTKIKIKSLNFLNLNTRNLGHLPSRIRQEEGIPMS